VLHTTQVRATGPVLLVPASGGLATGGGNVRGEAAGAAVTGQWRAVTGDSMWVIRATRKQIQCLDAGRGAFFGEGGAAALRERSVVTISARSGLTTEAWAADLNVELS
jgi:hypothetical protein